MQDQVMRTRERKVRGKWLTLSEESNAIDYLRKGYDFIEIAEKDPIAWKWVIISLHGALYGFAICACKGTSNFWVIEENNGDENKQAKLITIWKALRYCQNQDIMKMYTISKHLNLTKDQRKSMEHLINTFRNNFAHYIPRLWGIELHYFPKMVLDVLDVIEFLATKTGNTRLNEKQRITVESIARRSRSRLKKMKLYREYLQLTK
jgi:hypothetical protein